MTLEAQILQLRSENKEIKAMLSQVLAVIDPQGELITRAEAARILNCNVKTISHLSTKYPIKDNMAIGNKCYIRNEILKLKK